MKTSTKQTLQIVLFLISLFAVAGISVLFYLFHKQVQMPQTKALDAIPAHTALFFECTKSADFFAFHAKAEPLFKLFLNAKQQQNLQQMISVLQNKKHDFNIEKHSTALYFSVHPSREEMSLLFGIEVDKRYNTLAQQLATPYRKESFTYKNHEIQKLQIDKGILYFNHQNGLLLLSPDPSLLRASIDHILLKDSLLYHVAHSFAHKRDADVSIRLYMQYSQCASIFRKIMEEVKGDIRIISLLSPFSWSALNVEWKNKRSSFRAMRWQIRL